MQDTPKLATDENGRPDPGEFADALDAASDQDRSTWITDPDGKRIAALVPVDVLEHYQGLLTTAVRGRRHRQVEPELS